MEIGRLRLRLFRDDEVRKLGVLSVTHAHQRLGGTGSILDPRLGGVGRNQLCPTCRKENCTGHTGYIELCVPVWRAGFVPTIRHVHQCVCEVCGRLRFLPLKMDATQSKVVAECHVDDPKDNDGRLKRLSKLCRTVTKCPWNDAAIDSIQNTLDTMEDLYTLVKRRSILLESAAKELDVDVGLAQKLLDMYDPWYIQCVRDMCSKGSCGAPLPRYETESKVLVKRVWTFKYDCEGSERVYWTKPLTPDISERVFNSFDAYTCMKLGFSTTSEGTQPCQLVTRLQIVPTPMISPRMSVSAFGSSGRMVDDIANFLRQSIEQNHLLASTLRTLEEHELGWADKDPWSRWKSMEKLWNDMHTKWQRLMCMLCDIVDPSWSAKIDLKDHHAHTRRPTGSFETLTHRIDQKKGRFRKNMLGKRVDYSARTVVGPLPHYYDIWDIGIPEYVAKILDKPVQVPPEPSSTASPTQRRLYENLFGRISACVLKGYETLGGASMIVETDPLTHEERIISLEMMPTLEEREAFVKTRLKYPMVVRRYLQDGDWVMFNRQPTLHDGSWQSHRARIVPEKNFQLSEDAANNYNADFDGDEMNLHFPQTLLEEAECATLMANPYNTCSAGSNGPRQGHIQESVFASRMMTRQDTLFDEHQASEWLSCIRYDVNAEDYVRDPGAFPATDDWRTLTDVFGMPSILKPRRLWTGKQLLSAVLPKEFSFRLGKISGCMDDSTDSVLIRRGQLMYGRYSKSTVGASYHSIVDRMYLDCGPWATVKFLSDSRRMLGHFSRHYLVSSIGLRDCILDVDLRRVVRDRIKASVDRAMLLGSLSDVNPVDQEMAIVNELNRVRNELEGFVMSEVGEANDLWTLVDSGAKGKRVNVAQIMASLGLQMVNGSRPEKIRHTFVRDYGSSGSRMERSLQITKALVNRRTFPSIRYDDVHPSAQAFVSRSLSDGMSPNEFFTSSMSGRASLIETATKSSEAGYTLRKLMAGMSSNVMTFLGWTQNAHGRMIDCLYGEDGFDGQRMELVKVPWLKVSDDALRESTCDTLTTPLEWDVVRKGRELVRSARLFRKSSTWSDTFRLPWDLDQRLMDVGWTATPQSHVDMVMGLCDAFVKSHVVPEEHATSATMVLRGYTMMMCSPKRLRHAPRADVVRVFAKLLEDMRRALLHPAVPVGAKAAVSVGEPLLQMTMNTFHAVGQANETVVTGLHALQHLLGKHDDEPRAQLLVYFLEPVNRNAEFVKRMAKALQPVSLGSVIADMSVDKVPLQMASADAPVIDRVEWAMRHSVMHGPIRMYRYMSKKPSESVFSDWVLTLKLRRTTLVDLHMTVVDVWRRLTHIFESDALITYSPVGSMEWTVRIRLHSLEHFVLTADDDDEVLRLYRRLQHTIMNRLMLQNIPKILSARARSHRLHVVDPATNAIETREEWYLEMFGSGLHRFLYEDLVPFADTSRCTTTCVHDTIRTLGIEAGQTMLYRELKRIMSDSSVDDRHLWHVARVMTGTEQLQTFSRTNMDLSTIGRPAFETALQSLTQSVTWSLEDPMTSVTAQIVMGQKPRMLGTGSVHLLTNEDDADVSTTMVLPMESADTAEMQMTFVGTYLPFADHRRALVFDKSMVMDDVEEEGELTVVAPDMLFDPSSVGPELLAAEDVSQIVHRIQVLNDRLPNRLELEFRLKDAAPELFWMLMDELVKYHPGVGEWVHTMDVFYPFEDAEMRTIVFYSDSRVRSGHLPRAHVLKERIMPSTTANGLWGVVLSAERDVDPSHLPDTVTPTRVFHKLRKTFEWKQVTIDMTKVWEGETTRKAEALLARQREPSRYEVSVQCNSFVHLGTSTIKIAKSLLSVIKALERAMKQPT